jgi:sugar lactone lactonase YvrE
MSTGTPECAWAVGAELGEGPVWHAGERAVYFVDIKQSQIHRYAPSTGERATWTALAAPGFLVHHAGGGFICGLKDGLYRFDSRSGGFSRILEVEPHLPGNRLNDGFVDAGGYLWFGSMDDWEAQPTGTLYRVGDHGEAEARDQDYVITNGPTMSPDGATLYHGDTLRRVVYSFDVDAAGQLTRKRPFARIEGSGYPDGMAVDAEGFVWVALFGGARIERYAPDGRLVGQIPFPCANVTKLAFGGDDLRTVFATTARKGLSPDALSRQPLAGGLFTFRADVPGLLPTPCSKGFAL